MSKSKQFTVVVGFHSSAFGLGIHWDKFSCGADLGFFWIGVEW